MWLRLIRLARWFTGMGLAVLFAVPAHAVIYTYKDKDGVIHFTNAKDHPGAQVFNPNAADELPFGGEGQPRLANTPRMWAPVTVQNKKSERFEAFFEHAAKKYRLPVALIRAVTATESGFNPSVVSSAGACGLMQLMPGTAEEMKVTDIFDPRDNVMGGARYLRYLINHFNGDVKLAVAAYNAGPNLVGRIKRVPNIPETQGYVKRVLSLYRSYRKAEQVALRR